MDDDTNLGYPLQVVLIVVSTFFERISFCGVRTILSIYLRNALLYPENMATVIYHVFIMLSYIVPLVGAMLADSILGRYRTIFYFSIIYAAGNVLISLAATPPVSLPPVSSSMVALLLIAIGTGGMKPCVAAFGGDQFRIPEQEALLEKFFPIFYSTINLGGLIGVILTPILRKSVHCFGNDNCYSVGFGFPAILMTMAVVIFSAGRHSYRIKHPRDNPVYNFFAITWHAINKKIKSHDQPKKNWLDYASEKYESKRIRNMKKVYSVFLIFIPVPLFWSVFDQQGSRWTFQASRMNTQVFGIEFLPDQLQAINPAIVLILIPLFDKGIFPWMEQYNLLSTLLQRMAVGGLLASLAFIVSGILEIKLEETYPILPSIGESHLNFINTLPCEIEILNPFNDLQVVNSADNYVFRNVTVNNYSNYDVLIFPSSDCSKMKMSQSPTYFSFQPTKNMVHVYVVSAFNSKLKVFTVEYEDLKKSLSGKSKLRLIYMRQSKEATTFTLENDDGFQHIYNLPEDKEFSYYDYIEVKNGRYKYNVYLNNRLISKPSDFIDLEIGGVYNLIIQEENAELIFSKLYMMTVPNLVHIGWLLPQYVLISTAEVLFAIPGLQFSYSQAPKKLRTVTIAVWYLTVAIGNLIVVLIAEAHFFSTQAYEFFLFAGLLILDIIAFWFISRNFKFVSLERDGSSVFNFSHKLKTLNPSREVVK